MLENIFQIPRKIQNLIIVFFSVLVPFSIIIMCYVVINKMDSEVIIVTISFVNLLLTGSGIAILVLFTQQSTSFRLQLLEIDEFLTKEIPGQLSNTQFDLPGKIANWSANLEREKHHTIKVSLLHFRKVPKCWYFVETNFGEIAIYISATSYKLRISYFVPKDCVKDKNEFIRSFEPFFENVKSSDFMSGEIFDLPWTEADKYMIVHLSYAPKSSTIRDRVERLHIATLVSDLTRRFLLTCRKNDIRLKYDRSDFF